MHKKSWRYKEPNCSKNKNRSRI